MYVEIIGVIVLFVAVRALVTRNRAERLLYLNVIGFGVSSDFSSDLAMIIALSVFISFIAPTVFCECFRRQLKPVKSQRGASTYHRSGSEKLYVKKDIYLYKTVTRVRIRDDSSNSNPRRR